MQLKHQSEFNTTNQTLVGNYGLRIVSGQVLCDWLVRWALITEERNKERKKEMKGFVGFAPVFSY